MASDGFKGHEKGNEKDSDEEYRSSPELETVCEKCGIDIKAKLRISPKLCKLCKRARDRELNFSYARNLFPKPGKYAGPPRFSAETRKLMVEELKRLKQKMKEQEAEKAQQKSCEEKRKIEELEESQNTPSNSESEDAKPFEDDKALTTTEQPKSSKIQKTEMGAVHQKRSKETHSENVELQSKKILTQKVEAYPRAHTEGLSGFSPFAIMHDISLCAKCDCTRCVQPCMQCSGDNWYCQGTCKCCEVQRNFEEAMKDID